MADPVSIGIFVGPSQEWRCGGWSTRGAVGSLRQSPKDFHQVSQKYRRSPFLTGSTGLARIGKRAFRESLAAILLLIFASILVAAYFWIWFQESFTEKPHRKTPSSKPFFPALPDDQPRDDRELFELPW
jgi:hypothetical protein